MELCGFLPQLFRAPPGQANLAPSVSARWSSTQRWPSLWYLLETLSFVSPPAAAISLPYPERVNIKHEILIEINSQHIIANEMLRILTSLLFELQTSVRGQNGVER